MNRVCPSCGGIVGRDCFNPVECAQISESQRQQHDKDHYAEGYHQGFNEGYYAAMNELSSGKNVQECDATEDDSDKKAGSKKTDAAGTQIKQ